MEVDYYRQKMNERFFSRVVEQQTIENFKKIPEKLEYDGEKPADHPKAKF